VKIIGFIWYNEIVKKITQKHNVQQDEVREVFDIHPRFRFVEKGHKPEENVYAALGYKEIGEFWDIHDLADYWDKTKSVEFEIDVQSEVTYYAVEKELSGKIRAIAKQRGISEDMLLNLWIQEKLQEQMT
jgi:hypothetical protein